MSAPDLDFESLDRDHIYVVESDTHMAVLMGLVQTLGAKVTAAKKIDQPPRVVQWALQIDTRDVPPAFGQTHEQRISNFEGMIYLGSQQKRDFKAHDFYTLAHSFIDLQRNEDFLFHKDNPEAPCVGGSCPVSNHGGDNLEPVHS